VPAIEEEIDRLFGLALDEFTSARNDLVRRLKAEHEPEAAARIQALPKPAVAAWTVNQLVRVERDGVKALLEAGEALRIAQKHLLSGQDASEALRDATTREREAIRDLTKRAEAVLKESGRPATQTMLDRVAGTLRAAAVTDEGRRLLKAGRLTGELEAPGFDGLTGANVVSTPKARTQRARPTGTEERRRQQAEERRLKKEARARARELESAARAAEREAERAEAAAEKARDRAEKARTEADAAAELSGMRGRR
jgi:hypothetical protein